MVIEIPLSKTSKKNAGKYVAIVDDCDSDLLQFNWTIALFKNTVYAMRRPTDKEKRINTKMHRVIMERMIAPLKLEKGQFVDHIDRNGLNNTRANLRIATNAQNVANRKISSNNTTGVLGVYVIRKTKDGREFAAQIGVNGVKVYLGAFHSLEEAKAARMEAAKLYHKDFAHLD